jgi:phospholipid/cholesterol/gamma-HCH transport system substrate-binding protein
MRRNVIETIMGGVVLLVAVLFLLFAYTSSNVGRVSGYDITAQFNRVDGLSVGADVRMSGIKIGSVIGQRLDPKTYLADVRMAIESDIQLPTDTTAKIQADSLLSANYVNLEPGGDEKMIQPGGRVVNTQDPINLTDLIGRFIFSNSRGPGPKPPGDPDGQGEGSGPGSSGTAQDGGGAAPQ